MLQVSSTICLIPKHQLVVGENILVELCEGPVRGEGEELLGERGFLEAPQGLLGSGDQDVFDSGFLLGFFLLFLLGRDVDEEQLEVVGLGGDEVDLLVLLDHLVVHWFEEFAVETHDLFGLHFLVYLEPTEVSKGGEKRVVGAFSFDCIQH